jgi:hypothetical protein
MEDHFRKIVEDLHFLGKPDSANGERFEEFLA